MTFEELAILEPQLKELLAEARKSGESQWWGRYGLKYKMENLVGMYRGMYRKEGPPELQTSEAYDVCYRKLYGALLLD